MLPFPPNPNQEVFISKDSTSSKNANETTSSKNRTTKRKGGGYVKDRTLLRTDLMKYWMHPTHPTPFDAWCRNNLVISRGSMNRHIKNMLVNHKIDRNNMTEQQKRVLVND